VAVGEFVDQIKRFLANHRVQAVIAGLTQAGKDLWRILDGALIPAFADLADLVPPMAQPVRLLGGALGFLADHAGVARPLLVGIGTALVVWKTGNLLLNAAEGVRNLGGGFKMLRGALAAHPILLLAAVIVGLGVAFYTAWQKSETFREIVVGVLRTVVDKFLAAGEWIAKAAATAFGWVPGLGPKLRQAARDIEKFRDEANLAINGILKEKDVTIKFKAEYAGPPRPVLSAAGLPAAGPPMPVQSTKLVGPPLPTKGMAAGGLVRRGGWAWTGEAGPELGWWPAGAAVFPRTAVAAETTPLPSTFTRPNVEAASYTMPASEPPGDIVVHNTMELDGEVLWRSTKRYARQDLARQ